MKKVLLALIVITLGISSCTKQAATGPHTNSVVLDNKTTSDTVATIPMSDVKDKGVLLEAFSLLESGDITTYEEVYAALEGAFYDDELRSTISNIMSGMAASAVAGCSGISILAGLVIMVNEDCFFD